jgi:DNA invertase Pin-like site-specific DNA recombinase
MSISASSSQEAARFVAYYRVSTKKQGLTGLGMDAQRSAVTNYLKSQGAARATLLTEYIEVESGKRADRVELAKAIDHSKGARATLLIAKLDRLSRDAHFLTGLEKAGVEFLALDMPNANRMTVTILAAVAENELRQTSERTKVALAEKARRLALPGAEGQKLSDRSKAMLAAAGKPVKVRRLGNPIGELTMARISLLGNVAGVKAIKADADAKALGLQRALSEHCSGQSAQGAARKLNALGYRSPRGSTWTAKGVIRLQARLGALGGGS